MPQSKGKAVVKPEVKTKEVKSKAVVKPEVSKSNDKSKESKEARFKRLAEPRTKNVLRNLRILGNCSNRINYSYTQEQIEKIYLALQEALDNMFNKFTPSNQEQESFSLSD